MKQYLLLAALIAVVLVAACTPTGGQGVAVEPTAEPPADSGEATESTAAPTSAEENAMHGVTWLLTSYLNAQGQLTEALPDHDVTAEFKTDGQMGGQGGCNSYFASYTIDGDSITIGQAGSTMMACEPAEVMDQEAQFLAALTTAATWQVEGETLTLRNAAGEVVAEFQAAPAASLGGVIWTTVNLNTGDAVATLLPGTTITAEFGEDGRVTGTGGCNRYFASYTAEGNTITIGQAGSTMMACAEDIMAQEQQYLAALATAATWDVVNGQLTLYNAEGNILVVFDPQEATGLTGVTWAATGYNNGQQAVVSVLGDTIITAVFTEDGNLNGSAGCNNYMTSYTLDGQSITIQPAATTRKMCPGEGVMAQEAQYLNALTTAATWRIEGDKLELRTADGALVASFIAQPTQ